MTFDPDTVKRAIAQAVGLALGDAEAAAIAARLDTQRAAAAGYLARIAEGGTPADFAGALEAAAPRHG